MKLIRNELKQEFNNFKKAETNKNISIQKKALNMLVCFFIFMALMTICSRFADSATIPKVSVTSIVKNSLKHNIFIEGKIEADKLKPVFSETDLIVEEINVDEGQNIKVGDLIASFNLKNIDEKIENVKADIKKLQIELEKVSISTNEIIESEKEKAEVNLLNAQKDYEIDKKNLDFSIEKAQKDLLKAKEHLKNAYIKYDNAVKKYEKNSKDTYEDLNKEAEKNYIEVQNEYENFKIEYNKIILEKERILQDAKKELENLEEEPDYNKIREALSNLNSAYQSGDESAISAAESNYERVKYGDGGKKEFENNIESVKLQIKRAEEDLINTKEEQNKFLKQKEDKFNMQKQEYENIKLKEYDFEKDIKEQKDAIENAENELDNKFIALEEAKRNRELKLNESLKNIQKSEIEFEQAVKKDKNTQENNLKKNKINEIEEKKYKLDIELKNNELLKLNNIKKEYGKIYSPVDGTIIKLNIQTGGKTTEEQICLIAENNEIFKVKGKVSEEQAKFISQGDKIYVRFPEKISPAESLVESINFISTDNNYEITAILPEGKYDIGKNVNLEMTKSTDNYKTCIPIRSIHTDYLNQNYVLVVTESEGVLGKVLQASKVNINIIDKDNSIAAIESSLNDDDKIIESSNKNILEGDRVRIKNNE